MKKELKMEIEKEEKNKQCVGVDFYLTQQSLFKSLFKIADEYDFGLK